MPWPIGKKHTESTKHKMSENQKGVKNSFFGKKHSEEYKLNLSRCLKGRPQSELHRRRRAKAMTGKMHSEETKRKISQLLKGKVGPNKGKKLSENTKQRISNSRLGKYNGEKSPNWQGGISFLPYCPKFNHELKERIRKRDDRTCQLCGEKEAGRKLDVHHIHYDKPNCEPDLISLCHRCNVKVNYNRDFYEDFCMNILNKINNTCVGTNTRIVHDDYGKVEGTFND